MSLTLPIQVGKKYVRRDGKTVVVRGLHGLCDSIFFTDDGKKFNDGFVVSGRASSSGDHPFDLIADSIEPAVGHPQASFMAQAAPVAAAMPRKLPIPPAPADMADVIYAEGWNACCEAFFGGKPALEPIVITVTQQAAPVAAKALTVEEFIAIADATKSADPGRDGYILPITYGRAVQAAVILAMEGAQQAPDDPMDWPLPCDVTVGGGTMRKGVKLSTLVLRMKSLYKAATGFYADEVANRTTEERQALADAFMTKIATPLQAPPAQPEPQTTGWPPSELMQDDHSGLSKALSNTPHARLNAREAAAAISQPEPLLSDAEIVKVAELFVIVQRAHYFDRHAVIENYNEFAKAIEAAVIAKQTSALQTAPVAASAPSDAAAYLRKKAEDYASEQGYSDLGNLSFGRGECANNKEAHYLTLLELADELDAAAGLATTQRASTSVVDIERMTMALASTSIAVPIGMNREEKRAFICQAGTQQVPVALQDGVSATQCPGHSDGRHIQDFDGSCMGKDCTFNFRADK
jgi:hypothetical protein